MINNQYKITASVQTKQAPNECTLTFHNKKLHKWYIHNKNFKENIHIREWSNRQLKPYVYSKLKKHLLQKRRGIFLIAYKIFWD